MKKYLLPLIAVLLFVVSGCTNRIDSTQTPIPPITIAAKSISTDSHNDVTYYLTVVDKRNQGFKYEVTKEEWDKAIVGTLWGIDPKETVNDNVR